MARSMTHYTSAGRVAAATSRTAKVTRYACKHYPSCNTKPRASRSLIRPAKCRQHGLPMTKAV